MFDLGDNYPSEKKHPAGSLLFSVSRLADGLCLAVVLHLKCHCGILCGDIIHAVAR